MSKQYPKQYSILFDYATIAIYRVLIGVLSELKIHLCAHSYATEPIRYVGRCGIEGNTAT